MPVPNLDLGSVGVGSVLGSLVMLIIGYLNYLKGTKKTDSIERMAQNKLDHRMIEQIGAQLDLAWAQIRAEQAARVEDREYYQKLLKEVETEHHRRVDELRRELERLRQRTDPAEATGK